MNKVIRSVELENELGGVQRAGDMVRINVQLIDALTASPLWADTFERELTVQNIFSIQSEFATRIAAAMEVTLTAGERDQIGRVPTTNLDAYDYDLQAIEYQRRPDRLREDFDRAQRLYEQA